LLTVYTGCIVIELELVVVEEELLPDATNPDEFGANCVPVLEETIM
jgi:hypothetical protein